MKITRHKTVVVPYAILSDSKSWGGGPDESGSASAVAMTIDTGIEKALLILGGEYMTNTQKLQNVTATPLEMGDGSVFLIVTVIATLTPNKMADMRFLK